MDIFAHDMVLYPIHLGAHWCLAAVDFRHHQFHYYDSLLCSNGSCLSHLRAYLVAEARNKKGEELNLQGWTDVVPKVSVVHCLLSQLSFCLFPALHPLSLSPCLCRTFPCRRMALTVVYLHAW